MRIVPTLTCAALVLTSMRAGAQGGVPSTVYDSISSLSPAQRYAQICPGQREAGTGAIIGLVRDADDSTALPSATVSTKWIDMKLTTGRSAGSLASASTTTSSNGFYLLCGVPTLVRVNLRSARGGYVGSPAQLTLDDRLISRLDFALRRIDRIAGDTSLPSSQRAQQLAPVAIEEKAVLPSWMVRSGFETRRLQGMGAFVTEQDIARHGFLDLISVLQTARGVRVEWNSDKRSESGFSTPMPYFLGISSPQGGVLCRPNFFLDGAPFPVRGKEDYRDLSALLPPMWIKGIEVYSSSGTIPAQYDFTSSTGCGSIVIWTR